MNSLSLRVSSVKTGENVRKNAEMRAAVVGLPKEYENSESSYCVELKNARTVAEQVAAVKNIFKTLNRDLDALRFLAILYFSCPLKHPVRNQIVKLLITAARLGPSETDESVIVAALANALTHAVENARAETESCRWNSTISSLSGCFENFACGLKALEQSITIVFPFLCAAVQKYLTELGVLSSPSVRNEYYMYLHNAVRLGLACVQEYPSRLKDSENLPQLNVLCKQIILDDEIPMDPRTNSGIMMAQIAKIHDEYESFIQNVKLTKNPNEIVLCVGVVNTFDQYDFHQISADIRDVCSKIDEITNSNATVPNILLCASRAMYQISKIILGFELKPQGSATDDAKLILRKLLIFTFGYMEHHMDSVRHNCRDLLRNTVAAAKKLNFEFLLQKIYDACNSERLSLSMKCVVLQQSAVILGADTIIANCQNLFSALFDEHLGNDFMVNNLFESLMCASHNELDYDDWVKMWLDYLLQIAAANDKRLSDTEALIVKAIKYEPRIVYYIIDHTDITMPISTKLSALWAVRKAGIEVEDFTEILQKFSKFLLFSILSNSDETRIMALRLLVETHKSTEFLTQLECEHLLTYLEYNSNCQSPATRQKALSLLNKALIRCELNLVKLLKEQTLKKQVEKILQLKFLYDFVRILVSNLFPGANFSRRSTSLQLLEQCVHISINCNLNLTEILPTNTVKVLADMLNDSYEANKQCAVKVLSLIEDRLDYSLIEKEQLNITLVQIQAMLISLRPTDSVTGAYQLEFYCNRSDNISNFGHQELTIYNAVNFAALRWLLLELKAGLRTAKQSFLQAAKLNPLYGLLFAIKHILKRLEFTRLAQEIAWRILIAELIILCKELTAVVLPVVNSSSPEGHLPNDLGELPAEIGNDEGLEDSNSEKLSYKVLTSRVEKEALEKMKTTPQMVLLCAWRTVKEVSLILGEIVLRSPLQYSKLTDQFLITKEQLLEVGDHFKQLLAETKHRGAFEQAYVGFSKLCCRLWRAEVLDLNSLPMQWLRELIVLISKDEQVNEKICATRRSAGVPFMVQALITAELQVGTTKSLYYCMTHLLQVCATQSRSTEARTHALNIMRALFRCADLNDAVGEYVADGVICAIRSYDAAMWSEKNSATLLFAALITRIFGVQRSRDSDNLNVRNKMTGRIFFLRYPKLYDFFWEELQEASALVLQQRKANKLHPLLLILSRLYPSALEGTESNLKLCKFIPYISSCASCPEMQTRILSAKALVALISKDVIAETILEKCAQILLTGHELSNRNLNNLHGQLFQILMLIRTCKLLDSDLVGDISSTLVTFYKKNKIQNVVILKVILEILIEILQRLSNLSYPQRTIQQLLYFTSIKNLHDTQSSKFYPVFHKTFFIYNLHTLRLTLPFGALSDYLLSPPLTHSCRTIEQVESCLNIILLVLLQSNPNDSDNFNYLEISEFEISSHEKQVVRLLDTKMQQELSDELRQSKQLQSMLKELLQNPLYYPECEMKAYAILSQLDTFDMTLSHLMKVSKNLPNDVRLSVAMCVERIVIEQGGIDSKLSQCCLEYLLEIAQPWNPDCLRLKASNMLVHVAVYYPKALEKRKLTFVRSYVTLVLSLLMDDDSDIRDNTSKFVLNSLPDDIEMTSVVSTMAQRLFLQATADILAAVKSEDTLILDVFKSIIESLSTNVLADDENDSSARCIQMGYEAQEIEVFEKNEANIFAEPLKAISDTIVVFRNTFNKRPRVLKFINEYKILK